MSAWEEARALAKSSKVDWTKRRAEAAANPQRVILTERPVEQRPKDKIKPMLGEEPKKKKKGPTPEESKERKRRKKEKRRATIAARRRCVARRVDGKQCRARATIGELCGIHGKSRIAREEQDTYEPYEDYLRSDHWTNFKRKYYEIYVTECTYCKASDGVDLHHRTYANRGSENFSDVVPLCREHHYACHNYDRQHPEFPLEESTASWLNGAQPRLRSPDA